MEQLTLGDIIKYVKVLRQQGMTLEEIAKLPVYLGTDDELNGVHTGWYCQLIKHSVDDEYVRDLINDDGCNIKLADDAQAILIS